MIFVNNVGSGSIMIVCQEMILQYSVIHRFTALNVQLFFLMIFLFVAPSFFKSLDGMVPLSSHNNFAKAIK